MSRDDEKRWIKAALIIDVIGKPPEHLIETLNEIIKRIDEEKGVRVTSKKISESKPMKDHKDFFTAFVELEVELEDILYLAILMFKYMPAHIEIIEPEIIALTSHGWNDIFNELTRRLHGYDEIARVLQLEKAILEKKLREVLGEKISIKEQGTEIKQEKQVKREKKKKKKAKRNL